MPQIHEYAGEIDEYIGSMLAEYDELNRLYENSREENAVLRNQSAERETRETENVSEGNPTETLTSRELRLKILYLEGLVIELTSKLETETNVESE